MTTTQQDVPVISTDSQAGRALKTVEAMATAIKGGEKYGELWVGSQSKYPQIALGKARTAVARDLDITEPKARDLLYDLSNAGVLREWGNGSAKRLMLVTDFEAKEAEAIALDRHVREVCLSLREFGISAMLGTQGAYGSLYVPEDLKGRATYVTIVGTEACSYVLGLLNGAGD